MIKKTNAITYLLLLLVLGSCSNDDKRIDEVSEINDQFGMLGSFATSVRQENTDRLVVGRVSFNDAINLSEDWDIFRPSTMVFNDNNVFLYDYTSAKLVRVRNFNDVTTKQVAGRGPGEFLNPIDLKFGDEILYVLASRLSKISAFNNDLELLDEITLSFQPFRFVLSGKNFVVMNSNYDGSSLFKIVDTDGNKVGDIDYNVFGPSAGFYIQGNLTNDETSWYYGGIGLGMIRRYNFDSSLIWSRQTIKDGELISMHESFEDGNMQAARMSPNRIYRVSSLFVHNRELFVLHSGELRRSSKTIDVYDIQSGDYLRTYESDRLIFSMAVNEMGEKAAIVYESDTEAFILSQINLIN